MDANDPRHGQTRGYQAGCRDRCCRDARSKHENMRRLAAAAGHPYTVPTIGTTRRIRALMRLGWRGIDIAHAAGWQSGEAVTMLTGRTFLNHRTAERIRFAYDQLSMTCGPSEETRRRAEREGWPPPLAWDDDTIDDPNATPQGVPNTRPVAVGIDEVAVQRRMHGDRKVRLRGGEAAELVRRMLANGWSGRRIEEHTGVNANRYITREEVA
jgi:hypothetical protein